MTRDEARYEALNYVHAKLVHGATVDSMQGTIHEGFDAPAQPGYLIERGRITVPGAAYKAQQHRFSIAELVAEIESQAKEEFWRHWRDYRRDRTAADGYLSQAILGLRAIRVRHGVFPVPAGTAGFDHLKSGPVQGHLFGDAA